MALACQAVETSAAWVPIPVKDGSYDGLLQLPASGSGPGLILLQEIFGVGDFLTSRAAELAGEGYVVLCPDVFWRVEAHVALPHTEESMGAAFGYMQRFAAQPAELTRSDLVAALDALRARPEVTGPVGVMGYCLGGRLAYELAVASDPDCCVSYYGSGIGAELDQAGELRCPTLFHYGGADPYIDSAEIEAVRGAFTGRPNVEVVVQPGAGHAFENYLAPMFHDAGAAAVSWPLTLAFLRRHLQVR